MFLMRIIGLVNGVPTQYDKEYVVQYDPTPMKQGGEPILDTDKDRSKAKRFPSFVAAHKYYQQNSGLLRPWDKRPERPLTAWSVEIFEETTKSLYDPIKEEI